MRARLTLGLPVLLATAPAEAADQLALASGASGLVGLSVLSAAAVATAAWAIVRRRKADRYAGATESLLASAPMTYLVISDQARLFASPGLREWLRIAGPLGDIGQLGDGAEGLDQDGLAALSDAITALTVDRRPFRIMVRTKGGARVLEADGRRRQAADGGGGVVWFSDITIRADAEAGLRERADRLEREREILALTLNAAPYPIWRRGGDMAIEWVNKAYVSAVDGVSREQVIDSQAELVSHALAKSASETAREVLATGTAGSEKHFVVIDGQRRAVSIAQVPLESGTDVAAFAIDRTELEEARAELARHIEAHAETLNKLSAAVAIFGPDKTLEFFNSTFAQLWRLDEDWLATKPRHADVLESMQVKRRLPEQADFPAWKHGQLALYNKLIAPEEEFWHLPDASTVRVITQPHPFGGLLMIYEDVTDRLALEASFNTLSAVQRETLNNLYEGVAVFGGDGRLKLHNAAFENIWQLGGADLANSPHITEIVEHCHQVFGKDIDWREAAAVILEPGAERGTDSGRMTRKDASVIDYAVVPLPDGATLYTFLDVTDGSRIERALRERNQALETADRLKSEFIAHVSYELRTPLNTILGFTEILKKEYFGPLNDRQHEYVEGTLESSHQLLTLINDILDLATIEAGAMALDPTRFDFHAALTSVVAIARELAEKRGISIELECPSDIGEIEADERRIKQVLFNLLSNAIKFTLTDGLVRVGARAGDGEIEFHVSDTGIGMTGDEQVVAFEKFWTGSSGQQGRGAGLGLALVKNFVELHGGRIELLSEPGRGTDVRCVLPARAVAGENAAVPDETPVDQAGAGKSSATN